jgi:hypothetical protein
VAGRRIARIGHSGFPPSLHFGPGRTVTASRQVLKGLNEVLLPQRYPAHDQETSYSGGILRGIQGDDAGAPRMSEQGYLPESEVPTDRFQILSKALAVERGGVTDQGGPARSAWVDSTSAPFSSRMRWAGTTAGGTSYCHLCPET